VHGKNRVGGKSINTLLRGKGAKDLPKSLEGEMPEDQEKNNNEESTTWDPYNCADEVLGGGVLLKEGKEVYGPPTKRNSRAQEKWIFSMRTQGSA